MVSRTVLSQQGELLPLVVTQGPTAKIPKEKTIQANNNGYLSSIWTFSGSGGEQLYRWYGTLPNALLERLFGLYGKPRGHFLDPFLGMGGSLSAAQRAGMHAVGLDVNPLACLAAQTRLDPPRDPIAARASARSVLETNRVSKGPRRMKSLDGPEFAYTRKWFRQDTLDSLCELFRAIARVTDLPTQRLFLLGAAQVVREVASVDARCTHHLVTKKKSFIDPKPLWEKQAAHLITNLEAMGKCEGDWLVKQTSILEAQLPNQHFDFILLHPPYLGVIHYNQIHRLATDLLHSLQLEVDPVSLREFDFAHAAIKTADMSTDRSDRYFDFVQAVANTATTGLSKTGHCVVIIGDQRYKGALRHPFTEFIASFERNGLRLKELFLWALQNNGGMHVLRRGHHIDHNYVLVFGR